MRIYATIVFLFLLFPFITHSQEDSSGLRIFEKVEKEAAYPEFSMFGELPAWGFYVRHMEGLRMKNIEISIAAPDYRPALIFDDVKYLDIQSLTIQGDNKATRIVLHKTANVKMDNDQNVLKL